MRNTFFRLFFCNGIRRAPLGVLIVAGLLAVPLLCLAGTAEHECVCESSLCCAEESPCDLDPCIDTFKTEVLLHHAPVTTPGPRIPLIAVASSPARIPAPPDHDLPRNQPVPDSDLPLLI